MNWSHSVYWWTYQLIHQYTLRSAYQLIRSSVVSICRSTHCERSIDQCIDISIDTLINTVRSAYLLSQRINISIDTLIDTHWDQVISIDLEIKVLSELNRSMYRYFNWYIDRYTLRSAYRFYAGQFYQRIDISIDTLIDITHWDQRINWYAAQ